MQQLIAHDRNDPTASFPSFLYCQGVILSVFHTHTFYMTYWQQRGRKERMPGYAYTRIYMWIEVSTYV